MTRVKIDIAPRIRQPERMAKPGLGRGLGALLGGSSPVASRVPVSVPVAAPALPLGASADTVRRVPISDLHPCPFQPRKEFSDDALKELADSIREQGIVQPLVARERGGRLELIAGERRWRAAQSLGLAEVPVIVRDADDRAVLELALIENLQRENLNAIEEAQGYQQLLDQFRLTQEEVASRVGKNRASVANALRLLKLPNSVQDLLRHGRLSVGHAKVILGLPAEKQQSLAAERIVRDGLNVRQTETLVANLQKEPGSGAKSPIGVSKPVDTNLQALESRIREKLGTKIHLRYKQGKGALEIVFFSDDEFERILEILGVTAD